MPAPPRHEVRPVHSAGAEAFLETQNAPSLPSLQRGGATPGRSATPSHAPPRWANNNNDNNADFYLPPEWLASLPPMPPPDHPFWASCPPMPPGWVPPPNFPLPPALGGDYNNNNTAPPGGRPAARGFGSDAGGFDGPQDDGWEDVGAFVPSGAGGAATNTAATRTGSAPWETLTPRGARTGAALSSDAQRHPLSRTSVPGYDSTGTSNGNGRRAGSFPDDGFDGDQYDTEDAPGHDRRVHRAPIRGEQQPGPRGLASNTNGGTPLPTRPTRPPAAATPREWDRRDRHAAAAYNGRSRSPSEQEKRSIRLLVEGAADRFRTLHAKREAARNPTTTPRRYESQLQRMAARDSASNDDDDGGTLPAAELRRLREERLNNRRQSVVTERHRRQQELQQQQQQQQRKRSGSGAPPPRQESPHAAPSYGATPLPGQRLNAGAGTGTPGATTLRRLVGHVPRLEDALRDGVQTAVARSRSAADGAAHVDPYIGAPLSPQSLHAHEQAILQRQQQHRSDSHNNTSIAVSAVPPAASTPTPNAPPPLHSEAAKGVENLYRRMRSAYTELRQNPDAVLAAGGRNFGALSAPDNGQPKARAPSPLARLGATAAATTSGLASFAAPVASTPAPFLPKSMPFVASVPSVQTARLRDELAVIEQQWQRLNALQSAELAAASGIHAPSPTSGGGGSFGVGASTIGAFGFPSDDSDGVGRGAVGAAGGAATATKESVLARLHAAVPASGARNGGSLQGSPATAQGFGGDDGPNVHARIGAGMPPASALTVTADQALARVRERSSSRLASAFGEQ